MNSVHYRSIASYVIFAVIAGSLLLINNKDSAFACSCAPPLTPLEELDRSAAVFSGKVANIKEDSSRSAYEVRFFVERSWKGDFADRDFAPSVTVFTALDSAACGYAFEEDEKYLVYAYRSGESLDTNICSRTQPLGNAQEDLNALGAEWKIYKAKAEGQVFKIPYRFTNGNLREIEVDSDFSSIIVWIESHNDGAIELTIPRNLNDPRFDDGSDEFIVLVDGEEEKYEEVNNSACFRTLLIPIPGGAEELEFIGPAFIGGMPVAGMASKVPPVSFTTDKLDYVRGESIKVSGCTNLALDDKEVLLEILDNEGRVYQTVSVSPNRDGSFSAELVVEGEPAASDRYTIQATYAGYTAIPEFPVNLMAIAVVGLTAAVVALRLGSRISLW